MFLIVISISTGSVNSKNLKNEIREAINLWISFQWRPSASKLYFCSQQFGAVNFQKSVQLCNCTLALKIDGGQRSTKQLSSASRCDFSVSGDPNNCAVILKSKIWIVKKLLK
jgi:hypothetical protein